MSPGVIQESLLMHLPERGKNHPQPSKELCLSKYFQRNIILPVCYKLNIQCLYPTRRLLFLKLNPDTRIQLLEAIRKRLGMHEHIRTVILSKKTETLILNPGFNYANSHNCTFLNILLS